MAYADQFVVLALLFGAGLWAVTQFYRAKGTSFVNIALLALLLAMFAPVVGGLPAIGGGAGVDAVTGAAFVIIAVWAAQSLFRVPLSQAAAYLVLAWIAGAVLLQMF
jgi:hypothetical protein